MAEDVRFSSMLKRLETTVFKEEVDPSEVLWDSRYKGYAWDKLAKVGFVYYLPMGQKIEENKISEEKVLKNRWETYTLWRDILGRWWIRYTNYDMSYSGEILLTDEEAEEFSNIIDVGDNTKMSERFRQVEKRIVSRDPEPDVHIEDIDVFKLPPEIYNNNEARQRIEELADKLLIVKHGLGRDYAYLALFPDTFLTYVQRSSWVDEYPHLIVRFCGSEEKQTEIVNKYREFADSIYNALWETIQYIKYLYDREKYIAPMNDVYNFYSKVSRYIEVNISYNGKMNVTIYCPASLKGYLIGRNGETVKKLEEMLARKYGEARVRIYDDIELTDKYVGEKGLKIPKEAEDLVYKVLAQLKVLKDRYGIYPRYLEDLLFKVEEGRI